MRMVITCMTVTLDLEVLSICNLSLIISVPIPLSSQEQQECFEVVNLIEGHSHII